MLDGCTAEPFAMSVQNRETCLGWAVQQGFTEIVEALIGAGAAVNTRDRVLYVDSGLSQLMCDMLSRVGTLHSIRPRHINKSI